MLESKVYTCEYCGTPYKNKSACQECESHHKTPLMFIKSHYLPYKNMRSGHPNKLVIRFNDGSEVEYMKG